MSDRIIEAVTVELERVRVRRRRHAQRQETRRRFSGWKCRLQRLEEKMLLADPDVIEVHP